MQITGDWCWCRCGKHRPTFDLSRWVIDRPGLPYLTLSGSSQSPKLPEIIKRMEAEVLPRGRGRGEGVCHNISKKHKNIWQLGKRNLVIWPKISSRHFTLVSALSLRFHLAGSELLVFINAGQSFITASIPFSPFGI